MRFVSKLASVLKILVGVVFIISAVSKFVTIDAFEMYVFSFGLFPLVACFYLSRLLIGAEMLLGIALISHRNHRFTTLTSLLFLIFFVLFLVYAQLIGRTDSCHCFGDLLPFNPVQSILKNAVLILVLLFVFKYSSHEWYPRWWLVCVIYVVVAALFTLYTVQVLHTLDLLSLVFMVVALIVAVLASLPFYSRWWMTVPLILAPFVTTFILSPPDSWYFHEGDARYDEELFRAAVGVEGQEVVDVDSVSSIAFASIGLDEGRHLVAFFSPMCGFCRLAAEKISTIASRRNMATDRIVYVFPGGYDEERYEAFYEHSNSCRYAEIRIDRDLFVRITRAAFPVVLLVEDGEVKASYAYRSIDEQQISEFIGCNQ